jgi:negative regulator of flagellin synthesis FlgM
MNIPSGIGDVPQPLNVQGPAATSGAGQAGNLRQSSGNDVTSVAASTQSDVAKVSVSAGLLAQDVGGTDVRAGRVAELQQAIAAGTYSVPASAVADKLIESMLG